MPEIALTLSIKRLLVPAAVLLFVSCRDKPSSFQETQLLTFKSTTSDKFCEPDSAMRAAQPAGELLLLPNCKALYSIRKSDTLLYYRGTYNLIDNGVFCSFNAVLNLHENKTDSSGEKQISGLQPVRSWNLNVMKTGCSDFIYYSESGNMKQTPLGARVVYTDATPESIIAHAGRVNALPALIDFHRTPAVQPPDNYIGGGIAAAVLGHYEKKHAEHHLHKTNSDSVSELVFSYRKVPAGQEPGPFLYVTLSRLRSDVITGDLNGDGRPDLIVQPVLSQGGNSYWKDLFVFVNTPDGYLFKTVASNMDLAQYTVGAHSGSFHAERIGDGAIIGTSICYTDEDAACCPSVKVPTLVRLSGDKLVAAMPGK